VSVLSSASVERVLPDSWRLIVGWGAPPLASLLFSRRAAWPELDIVDDDDDNGNVMEPRPLSRRPSRSPGFSLGSESMLLPAALKVTHLLLLRLTRLLELLDRTNSLNRLSHLVVFVLLDCCCDMCCDGLGLIVVVEQCEPLALLCILGGRMQLDSSPLLSPS
jgi:hypothetical protein